ncbi:hypothetical protein FF38_13103 [Lucilia cuprina]|uniref:BRCA1-associated ATM activator 1 n=1 Tax=Lucilia cuprina TaxID=7375 RepID=A0A0L0CK01_LUCCU|nr:BRCA1-associated ATM activator 1 [Lucilia cuprina]KAI8129655.1 BRCA1-associated ATM activator 1 [Lucilia cuprina]KNC32575.1 hypothetical protein FF38_13103 [Lucilia cuprina]
MEQQQQIIERLQRIFETFLQKDFATTSNVYFEKLITHLADKENLYVLQAPFAMDWVDKCITLLNEDFTKVNPKVTSFMLNFCSLLMQNEWILITLKERNIMDRALVIIEGNRHRFSPSIKLGFIRLLAAVSRYSLGLAYIRLKQCWHFLIELCNRDHTMYVVREARQLLYELLYKFSVKAKDEKVVLEMLSEIIEPIKENVYKEGSDKIMINVDDTELQHRLSSSLDLLSYIFEQTLESEEKTNITHLCRNYHNLELTIWKLIEMTQNRFFLYKILHTLASFNYAVLVQDQWDKGQIAPEKFTRFGLNFFNSMKFCVQRSEILNLIKLAELNHMLWKKLGKRAPPEIWIETELVKFENQLITFHLLPVLVILRSREREEELFDNYLMKIFEVSCEHTLRICYSFRDIILPSEGTSLAAIADLAYKSIHGILSMQNILEREPAVMVFQAIIYALKEFIANTNTYEKNNCPMEGRVVPSWCKIWMGAEFIVAIPNVLYACLIGLQSLIKRYRISWKESIESTCVVNTVAVILENPNLTEGLAVQALKLVQLSIEHFLSPNMALLVDNLQGSGLVCLGPIIVKRFHDIAWEVRDSTLELTTSIANISRVKFPAFQQFLHDYKMCPIVLQMAKNDQEPYVRASALKCLSKMVLINIIWDNDLNNQDLIDHLFFVLFNESEGIVRKEAMKTLATIYEHRRIPSRYMDTLYSTLAHCVISDLHWEVKLEALHFWELEFKKQFTNQGMIDGTFPTVTFSKEYKKIVTLTEKEINLRILKVFKELSLRGCLGVILKCLQEECDLEVIKTAVCMVHCLLEKLKKYNFESLVESIDKNSSPSNSSNSNSAPNTPLTTPNSPLFDKNLDLKDILNEKPLDTINANIVIPIPAPLTLAQHAQSDEVIESILSSQDINLLVASYESQMQLNNGNSSTSSTAHIPSNNSLTPSEQLNPNIDPELYKAYTAVGVKEFMQTIKSLDLEQLLKNHNDWFLGSESFISLLDDIIFAMKQEDESLFADCY